MIKKKNSATQTASRGATTPWYYSPRVSNPKRKYKKTVTTRKTGGLLMVALLVGVGYLVYRNYNQSV